MEYHLDNLFAFAKFHNYTNTKSFLCISFVKAYIYTNYINEFVEIAFKKNNGGKFQTIKIILIA